ncbi:MAG TPA: autotransporter outer membrane beta-barrel domain-containing protein, partial [Verrucomicrobiaceae bacterium]
PGASYVAFFSASNNFNGISGDARMGLDSSGSYPGGGFYFLNNGNNFGAVTTNNWDPTFSFLDLAFDFVFLGPGQQTRGEVPVVLVVDQAAISSALFSSVPTALAQRELSLGASRTTLRDFNGRLFRHRAGIDEVEIHDDADLEYHTVTLGEGDGVETTLGARGRTIVYSTPRPEARRWEIFTSFDYGGLDMDADRNFLGLRSNTYAESIGVEHALGRHFLAGGGVSYIESEGQATDINGETLAAYVSFAQDGWYADLLYGATFLDHRIHRDTGFGGIANASPNSVTHTVSFNTGYNFHPGRWSLGPIAGIDYAHAGIDGYTESGGGNAATRVSGQSVDSLLTRAGAQASYRVEYRWGAVTPQLRLGWERENLGSDSDLTVALLHSPYYLVQGSSVRNTGTPFAATVAGENRERDYMTVGAGVMLEMGRHLNLLFDYEGDFLGRGFVAHYGKVSLGWNF